MKLVGVVLLLVGMGGSAVYGMEFRGKRVDVFVDLPSVESLEEILTVNDYEDFIEEVNLHTRLGGKHRNMGAVLQEVIRAFKVCRDCYTRERTLAVLALMLGDEVVWEHLGLGMTFQVKPHIL